MRARDIMSRPAVCVAVGTTIGEVAAILADNGFSAVPVVEGGRLVGLVSEADLIRERFGLREGAEHGDPRTTAGELMTSPVEFVRPETTVSALAKCMITGRRRSVPVVEGQRVVGVVTRRDVVQAMTHSDDAILEAVHRRLELAGFPQRWLIRVQSGVVHLWGEADPRFQHEALVVAESVPGVVRVTLSGPMRSDPTTVACAGGGGIAETRR